MLGVGVFSCAEMKDMIASFQIKYENGDISGIYGGTLEESEDIEVYF